MNISPPGRRSRRPTSAYLSLAPYSDCIRATADPTRFCETIRLAAGDKARRRPAAGAGRGRGLGRAARALSPHCWGPYENRTRFRFSGRARLPCCSRRDMGRRPMARRRSTSGPAPLSSQSPARRWSSAAWFRGETPAEIVLRVEDGQFDGLSEPRQRGAAPAARAVRLAFSAGRRQDVNGYRVLDAHDIRRLMLFEPNRSERVKVELFGLEPAPKLPEGAVGYSLGRRTRR